jgi:hypothetical protein
MLNKFWNKRIIDYFIRLSGKSITVKKDGKLSKVKKLVHFLQNSVIFPKRNLDRI